jgi:hypothetical protein
MYWKTNLSANSVQSKAFHYLSLQQYPQTKMSLSQPPFFIKNKTQTVMVGHVEQRQTYVGVTRKWR